MRKWWVEAREPGELCPSPIVVPGSVAAAALLAFLEDAFDAAGLVEHRRGRRLHGVGRGTFRGHARPPQRRLGVRQQAVLAQRVLGQPGDDRERDQDYD